MRVGSEYPTFAGMVLDLMVLKEKNFSIAIFKVFATSIVIRRVVGS